MKKIISIFKKPQWFIVMATLCLGIVFLFLATTGCEEQKNQPEINPLNDLPWLKAKVDEITLLSQDNPFHVAIYQCSYGDGQTGFLEDRGNVAFFYNCEGEVLCAMGGIMGATCPELNIDFQNEKLIWELNNDNNFIDGYIVGYESCSGTQIFENYGEANAYYIISENLKDTFLTYNFPKDIFYFPLECIKNTSMVTPVWFDENYRYAFKAHIEYKTVSENEKQYSVCPANVLLLPQGNGTQIKIKSVSKFVEFIFSQ